ncbi:hypothetical protein D3C81_1294860 [compost metagenome]
MPGRGSGSIRRPGETPQALDALEEAGARQPAGALADHQRAAQWTLGAGIERGQVLEGGGEGLHRRSRQLQAFDQRPVGQQVALAAGVFQFVQQGLPVLAADTQAQDPDSQPETPRTRARLRLMASSGSRSPLSINPR